MRLSPSAVPTTLTSFSPVLHHDLLRIVLPAFCMLELFEVISLRILHVDERLWVERRLRLNLFRIRANSAAWTVGPHCVTPDRGRLRARLMSH